VAAEKPAETPAGKAGGAEQLPGAKLLETKGCAACHTTDGTAKVGPTLKGIFSRTETVVTGKAEHQIAVDEEYLRRAITDPTADVVKGFAPLMPPMPLTKEELDAIVAYLKTLKAVAP
jgi:cytochrome c oxidase subunit 2